MWHISVIVTNKEEVYDISSYNGNNRINFESKDVIHTY